MNIKRTFSTRFKLQPAASADKVLTAGLFALAFALSSVSLADEFYKWVDENGVTHYTQTPPKEPGVSSQKIRASGTTVNQDEAAKARQRLETSRSSFQTSAEQRAITKGLEEEEKEKALKLAKYCEDARKNLKVLNEHARIREKGKDGEYKVLSEEEKQAKVARNQKHVKEYCK